jgi:hypothetical protein
VLAQLCSRLVAIGARLGTCTSHTHQAHHTHHCIYAWDVVLPQVVRIERIQNARLWRKFDIFRRDLQELRGNSGACVPPAQRLGADVLEHMRAGAPRSTRISVAPPVPAPRWSQVWGNACCSTARVSAPRWRLLAAALTFAWSRTPQREHLRVMTLRCQL